MPDLVDDIEAVTKSIYGCIGGADHRVHPFEHWLLGLSPVSSKPCLPRRVLFDLTQLALPAPVAYLNPAVRAAHPLCDLVAHAFQDPRVVDRIANTCRVDLNGTYLHLAYTQDGEGHARAADVGPRSKLLTLMLYLSGSDGAGTDLFDTAGRHIGRVPFAVNAGIMFALSPTAYHGFLPRRMPLMRKSLVASYVTAEFAHPEQLAFPLDPLDEVVLEVLPGTPRKRP
jgi:hypothetical protein